MRSILLVVFSILLFASSGLSQTAVVGAWNVTFSFEGLPAPQQMRFVALDNRTGVFRFISPSATAVSAAFPAVWDRPDPFFFSAAGNVQFGPTGPSGTLVFKGRSRGSGRFAGSVIFVQDAVGPATTASPFIMRFGSFTAVPTVVSTQ